MSFDGTVDKVHQLSLRRESSEDIQSEGVSLYSSKDTLSATESWLRSRAVSQYVPEPSPKTPTSHYQNSPSKGSSIDRQAEDQGDQNAKEIGKSEEQSTTPRAGGIFRIKHATAELLSANTTLSESQRVKQTPPQAAASSIDSRSDETACSAAGRIVLDPVEDQDRETRRLRERARQWAAREGLTTTQAAELEMLLDLAGSTFIPRSSLENLKQIDRGAPPSRVVPSAAHPQATKEPLRTALRRDCVTLPSAQRAGPAYGNRQMHV